MPPNPPTAPPIPTTEPTALLGNTSEVVVNRFADQPWWAAVARLTSATASKALSASTAVAATGMQKAHNAIAVLRAFPFGQPRRIRKPESHPPITLPRSAAK